jgi:hypothetical protein
MVDDRRFSIWLLIRRAPIIGADVNFGEAHSLCCEKVH